MKSLTTILLITMLLCIAVMFPNESTAQERRITGETWFGCVDRDYHGKLIRYAVQKDKEAFGKGLAAGVLTGKCVLFQSGESVFITDGAFFSGMIKVRRKGDTAEYWTNMEATR